MARLFGTDGVRGVAGRELTASLAMEVGAAAAMVLAAETHKKPLVIIGRDTRASGDLLEAAAAAGLCAVGADVLLLGVVPTPAVAYLVQRYHADAGVMLSASHNPYEFNGIKLFGPKGFKLTDAEEDRIEELVRSGRALDGQKSGGEVGRISRAQSAAEDYTAFLASHYRGGFSGRILADCANGSAAVTAGRLFERLGVSADLFACGPDGVNINDCCGSTHIERLAARVKASGYDLGLAFDGDADRLLAVDEQGNVLDGDFLLAILGDYLSGRKAIAKNTVVVTSMTNLGFFQLMRRRGTATEVTKVGDRYVLEAMLREGCSLGGEQSGHMIFLDLATTGDGQLSAVMLLNAIAAAGRPLSELGSAMKRFPQTMKNVSATPAAKEAYECDPAVSAAIADWSRTLEGRGRVVVRPSGTEPYIRVMVEWESAAEIERAADEIAAAIEKLQ